MKYFELLLTLLLVFCFSIQVQDGFFKFIKRQTTVVSTTKTHDRQILPVISFCPGFKNKTMNSFHYIIRPYDISIDRRGNVSWVFKEYFGALRDNFFVDLTEAILMEWWNNVTFDPSVLAYIKPPTGDESWTDGPVTMIDRAGDYDDIKSTVKEISTMYGRCYSIYFDWPMADKELFTLLFDFRKIDNLVIYAHEPYNEIGLHLNYWPITPESLALNGGDDINIVFHKNYFKPIVENDNAKCNNDKEYSYPKCVLDWARDAFRKAYQKEDRQACWYPGNLYIANPTNKDIKPCLKTEEETNSKSMTLVHVIEKMNYQKIAKCPRSCQRTSYQLKHLRYPVRMAPKSMSQIFLSVSMDSQYREEVLVYDFNSILSAMGGSLGLFLGISFYSVASYIWQCKKRFSNRIHFET